MGSDACGTQGDARAHDLLNERLEKDWHSAVQYRVDDDEMLRRNDGSLWFDETFGQITVLEIPLCAQNGELEVRHVNTRHFISGSRCTLRLGIGERMAEAITARIGITLDNG